jgi:hypothetical protein
MGQDDLEVTVYTREEAPFGLFGSQATAAPRLDLEKAGVRAQTGVNVAEDLQTPGRLVLHPGERPLDAERVVALPRAVGPGLPGLPSDARGFVLTDLHGKVPDVERVWAARDAIAFPVKQGGLASQQADAAAESIAAAAGAKLEPPPFRPVLRGAMLTGRGKEWMRTSPQTSPGRERRSGARCGGRHEDRRTVPVALPGGTARHRRARRRFAARWPSRRARLGRELPSAADAPSEPARRVRARTPCPAPGRGAPRQLAARLASGSADPGDAYMISDVPAT